MKPTPEQVEAAKAWMKDSCSVQQYRVIREYKPMLESLGDVSDNVSLILLAALEAAEADGARLDWLEKAPASTYPSIDPDPAIGLMHFVAVVEDNPHERRGHLGKTLREAIDAARKEDRT